MYVLSGALEQLLHVRNLPWPICRHAGQVQSTGLVKHTMCRLHVCKSSDMLETGGGPSAIGEASGGAAGSNLECCLPHSGSSPFKLTDHQHNWPILLYLGELLCCRGVLGSVLRILITACTLSPGHHCIGKLCGVTKSGIILV